MPLVDCIVDSTPWFFFVPSAALAPPAPAHDLARTAAASSLVCTSGAPAATLYLDTLELAAVRETARQLGSVGARASGGPTDLGRVARQKHTRRLEVWQAHTL